MKARDAHQLEAAIGHRFRRPDLLQQALTHSSHARELESQGSAKAVADNEQLEFLGDAVLGFVVGQELFQRFPNYSEGELSKLRAHLVSGRYLLRVARQLQLGHYLHLSRGEEKSGGRTKAALLVDGLEAVVAAIYLDVGLEAARRFILTHILVPELERMEQADGQAMPITDYKSALQEAVHATGRSQPMYVLVREEGPEHRKTFTVEARIHRASTSRGRAEYVARASGSTKKKAEQEAARQALDYLRSKGGGAGPSS